MTVSLILVLTISLVYQNPFAMGQDSISSVSISNQWPNIMSNVKTFVVENVTSPKIDDSAFVHPFAIIIGDCSIGKDGTSGPHCCL